MSVVLEMTKTHGIEWQYRLAVRSDNRFICHVPQAKITKLHSFRCWNIGKTYHTHTLRS